MGNAFKKPEEFSKACTESIVENRKSLIFNQGSTSTSFFSNWSFRSNRTNFSVSSLGYSKTKWPRPSNIIIFASHFKLLSREKELQIRNEISKGAFGTVIKVTDIRVNQDYALKVLKKSLLIQENFIEQIKLEVDIHKVCSHHPFIASFVECWQSRYNIYILSEYISRGELFNKICNFSFELIKLYVAEISLAIDFLHNAGIIYRDLKPENILLSESYHIKLIDFGLSKWLKIGNKTKTICGTLQYMAPEILREEYYDHAVDWWSLGILTCRMLTNNYPDIRKILNEELINEIHLKDDICEKDKLIDTYFFPDEYEYIPLEAKDLLKRLLEFNSKNRLNSVLKLKRIAFFQNFNFKLDALRQMLPNIIEEQIVVDCLVPVYV